MIISETIMDKMPECCVECDLFQRWLCKCLPSGIVFEDKDIKMLLTKRLACCPLREVEKIEEVVNGKY